MAKHCRNGKVNHIKTIFTIIIVILIAISITMLSKNIKINREKRETQSFEDKEINFSNYRLEQNEVNNTHIINNKENESNNLKNNNVEGKNNSIKISESTEIKTNTTGLPVLMYHFFYDEGKTKKTDNNCISTTDFEKQIKYLSENNFYFPSWEEVENYIDGKTSLPSKSVVITADDGDPSFFELAIPIIEKYNVKATSFVITSWYSAYCDKYPSKDVSYQSHSDNMHMGGKNGKGVMLSWPESKILADVKKSSETLHRSYNILLSARRL